MNCKCLFRNIAQMQEKNQGCSLEGVEVLCGLLCWLGLMSPLALLHGLDRFVKGGCVHCFAHCHTKTQSPFQSKLTHNVGATSTQTLP